MTDAKTDDHFFLGFPSYWNVVAFYVVVLDLGVAVDDRAAARAVGAGRSCPVKYVYPSRTPTLWALNMALAVVWLASYAVITATLPDPTLVAVRSSLVPTVAYYVGVLRVDA